MYLLERYNNWHIYKSLKSQSADHQWSPGTNKCAWKVGRNKYTLHDTKCSFQILINVTVVCRSAVNSFSTVAIIVTLTVMQILYYIDIADCRCYPGIVPAAGVNDADPGLDHAVHTNSVRRRRRSPAVQGTVKDEGARRLQVRARPVGGRHDDDRARVRFSRRPSQRNRKSRARLLRLQQSQVRDARPHHRAPSGRRLRRSKTHIFLRYTARYDTTRLSILLLISQMSSGMCRWRKWWRLAGRGGRGRHTLSIEKQTWI